MQDISAVSSPKHLVMASPYFGERSVDCTHTHTHTHTHRFCLWTVCAICVTLRTQEKQASGGFCQVNGPSEMDTYEVITDRLIYRNLERGDLREHTFWLLLRSQYRNGGWEVKVCRGHLVSVSR